jgi:Bacterial Ig-like domain
VNRKSVVAALVVLAVAAGSCVESTAPTSIGAPTNVTATLAGAHSVLVTWTPPPENKVVESYSIFRDGVKVGESVEATFLDTGLLEKTMYKYRVSARGLGLVSELSAESPAATLLIPDISPPTLVSTSPATGQAGVSLAANISASFSEAMDPATLTPATFIVTTSGGALIPGNVTYASASNTAQFTPTNPLPNAGTVLVNITTGVKDVAGNSLAADYHFNFTTRDETPPTVVSATPPSSAAGISTKVVVSVVFSEPMDPATINASTVALKLTSSGLTVGGDVAYNAQTSTATFAPSAALSYSTSYTIMVSTGAKDLAGNSLVSQMTSTFTTTSAPDVTPPSVISTSPANGTTGVGVSTSVTVTFSEAMNPATIDASTIGLNVTGTAVTVAGAVSYNAATNTATFTPSSSLAFGTSYTLTVSGGADVSGNAIASAFTAIFATVDAPDTTPPSVIAILPANGASGVSVSIVATVTFSESMDPATVGASTINLVAAANSLPAPATVSYNTATRTATVTPSAALAFNASYTLTVGVGAKDLAGNSLAGAVTATFTTAGPPDTTPPEVVSTAPANLTSNNFVNIAVAITFSEAMNPATINASNIVLKQTGTAIVVWGTLAYGAATNTATFTPSSALAFSTSFTLTIAGVTDVAGNALASTFSTVFGTAGPPDTTPPTVLSAHPAHGATSVAIAVNPTVTFSEPMNGVTITTATITLRVASNGSLVAGNVSYNPATNAATFGPSSLLAYSTGYTLTVSTGVQDIAGNSMASIFTSGFTTEASPDTTRPTIISFVRLGRVGAPLENPSRTSVTFSEAMNPASINGSSVTLQDDRSGASIAGTVTYDAGTRTATFAASSPLGYRQSGGTSYTLTVTTAATDLAGNALAENWMVSATRISYFQGTTAVSDTTQPEIHVHITFSQSGQILGKAADCQPLPTADCDVLPKNAAGIAVVGTLDDTHAGGDGDADAGALGVAATITAVSGNYSTPTITFTFTLANGRTFTFTGTMTNVDTMSGTISGTTLASPIPIVLSRAG